MRPRVLWITTGVAALYMVGAMLAWIAANPFPAQLDEALYANQILYDAHVVRLGSFSDLPGLVFRVDPARPPAYRMLALPFTLTLGTSLRIARLVSIAGFLSAAAWMSLAVRRIAGDAGGALCMLGVLGSPTLVATDRLFHTEYALLLALAGTLWFLAASRATRRWIWLGLCVALGLYAKTSYLLALAPIAVVAFVAGKRWNEVLARADLVKALLLGAALALPWWSVNGRFALEFASDALHFGRQSLGDPHSLRTLLLFAAETARCATGYGLPIVSVLVAGLAWLGRGERSTLDRSRASLAWLTLAGALPFPLTTYLSLNHSPRMLVPAVFLLCAAVATVASSLLPDARVGIASVVLVAQILVLAFPRRWSASDAERSLIWRGELDVMAPIEQWDWTPLQRFLDQHGFENPRIAMLGEGYQFNPPMLLYPWMKDGRRATITQLTQWDRSTLERAARGDVVVTVPGFRGDPRDGHPALNAHNEELLERIRRDPRFEGPYAIDVGIRQPVRAVVLLTTTRAGARP